MSQEKPITPPPVIWAQKSGVLFVTICLEDCKNPIVKIEPEKIYFRGVGGTEKKDHEITINLFDEIDPTKTIQHGRRHYEMTLYKKKSGPYWPRLTKENNKYHWLKCDFSKWVDEESSGSDSEQGDFERKLADLGYNMGGADSKPSLDDLPNDIDEHSDSDDETLPDLE